MQLRRRRLHRRCLRNWRTACWGCCTQFPIWPRSDNGTNPPTLRSLPVSSSRSQTTKTFRMMPSSNNTGVTSHLNITTSSVTGITPCFFSPQRPFATSPRGPSATRAPAAQSSHTCYARREARGGDSAESARTSLSKGDSPSTLAVLEIGKESKLAAKDLAAATGNNPDHRPTNGSDCCCTLQREGSACPCSSQQPDEVGRFRTPASANLDA